MLVSSPSSRSGSVSGAHLLAFGGTAAFLVLLVILVTGGFSFDAGPIHVSAHSWIGALGTAIVLWGLAIVLAHGEAAQLGSAVHRHVIARAALIATVLSASAAGAAVAFGTYAASGSDASGYINQANSMAQGSLTIDEPLWQSIAWPDATTVLAPLGYRGGSRAGELVPTYPPGLPLVMAAAQRIAGETGLFLVVPLFGAAAVFATYLLGARLHSREAGIGAAVLLTTSPIFLFQIVQPMSDVPALCWWTLALLFACRESTAGQVIAGIAAGLAVMTRPNLVVLAPAIPLVAVRVWRTERPQAADAITTALRRCIIGYGGGLLVPVIVLLLIQRRLYGSPFASGYGTLGELFAPDAIVPNLIGYGSRLWRGELPAILLATGSAATLLTMRRTAVSTARPRPLAAAMWPAAVVGFVVLACYLPYAAFAEWSYLRFLLPAFPVLLIAVGALVAEAAHRLPGPMMPVALLGALTLAASFNIRIAEREQAFRLRDYEARYRLAGRYLEAALPDNAVVVTVQESGSARYYTRLPTVRWDLLDVELDSAMSDLLTRGYQPILLIEQPEVAALRERFPRSALARLDWPPLATIEGATTRVDAFGPRVVELSNRNVTDVIR